MARDPPPFARSDYWNERFTKNPSAFDWLLPANCLDGPIIEAIQASHTPYPRLLHIGCGTSILSLHLRYHVEDPRQIHNTDFSHVAIELGAKWEREVFESDAKAQEASESGNGSEKAPKLNSAPSPEKSGEESMSISSDSLGHPPRMRWSTLDLLSLPSIRAISEKETYDIIVDKSTCDAISCGDDVRVPLPYPLLPTDAASNAEGEMSMVHIHPLHILGLHLASLVPAGGRWIALSYSGHRFPFFEPYPATVEEGKLDEELLQKGFVHPGRLWRLERQEMVELEDDGGSTEGRGIVHRPKTAHWIYVMVRTDVVLNVRR
ncbi:hypothetical protein B0J12DRAFT_658266 [Macrophomina phaseolina]|uniref:Methyltransferase type 11 n=1 Tax=Macrophomina phaseolina TaxID=35725 RepID=A0ABQ8GG74_9PEZI|nr:hypothetical protein B0J12DRAFT_658266 [Macrophomina phaseolina]